MVGIDQETMVVFQYAPVLETKRLVIGRTWAVITCSVHEDSEWLFVYRKTPIKARSCTGRERFHHFVTKVSFSAPWIEPLFQVSYSGKLLYNRTELD